MKTRIALTLLTIIAIALPLIAQSQPDWPGLERYRAANALLASHADTACLVVFMGNSITEYWEELNPDFFTRNNYVCRGISGQTTYQMVVRFRQDVINLHPRAVVISAGTNDIAENTCPYDEAATMGNIVSMVELAQASGIVPIVASLLPCDRYCWNLDIENVAEKIASLNALLKAYATEHHLVYIDYFTPMVHSDGRSLNPAYTLDGVHPEIAGYDVMAPLAQQAIAKALQ